MKKKAKISGAINGIFLYAIMFMQYSLLWVFFNASMNLYYTALVLIIVITISLCTKKTIKLSLLSLFVSSIIYFPALIIMYAYANEIYYMVFKEEIYMVSDAGEEYLLIQQIFICYIIGFLITVILSAIWQHLRNKMSR